MVNETVVSYLKDNYPTYDIDTLKKEIMSGGYTEEEFNDAVKTLNIGKTPVKTESTQQIIPPQQSTPTTPGPQTEPKKEVIQTTPAKTTTTPSTTSQVITTTPTTPVSSTVITIPVATLATTSTTPTNSNFLFKQEQPKANPLPATSSLKDAETQYKGNPWMKIAGVIGFILMLFNISFFGLNIYSSTQVPSLISTSTPLQYTIFFISIFSMILFIFYLYGFVRMGRIADSKSLKFSSWALITLMILGILSLVILVLIALTSGISPITANAISSIDNPEQEAVLGQLSPAMGLTASSMGMLFFAILGLVLLVFLFIFIVGILFFVGLIKSGKQIKYAKPAGIIGLIILIFTSLFMLAMPFMLIMSLFTGPMILYFMLATNICLMIAGLVQLTLMNLALFDASKKFESK